MHLWFHEEHLTISTDPLDISLDFYNVFTLRKKWFTLRKKELFTEKFYGEAKMVLQWNRCENPFWSLYF